MCLCRRERVKLCAEGRRFAETRIWSHGHLLMPRTYQRSAAGPEDRSCRPARRSTAVRRIPSTTSAACTLCPPCVAARQDASVDSADIGSPDGRWLAYEANDSGQLEIHVRPYPDVNSGHWRVSTGGGTRPLWSRTGRELFYVSPTDAILRIGVEPGASWTTTPPAIVVKEGYGTATAAFPGRSYDVSPDGQRFLVLKPASEPNTAPPQLVVVQHFDEELKRLVPVN